MSTMSNTAGARLRLILRRWRQRRCLHSWRPDPPGWKCSHCDTPAPPGAFAQGRGAVSYRGEGQP